MPINIPLAELGLDKECVKCMCILPQDHALIVVSGKRNITIKGKDVDNYLSKRGRRGVFLPQGFRRVDRLEY